MRYTYRRILTHTATPGCWYPWRRLRFLLSSCSLGITVHDQHWFSRWLGVSKANNPWL